ncbi:MAG TPA: hypothetical protein VM871_10105 [Flavisolibacter sp.]|nr:hypothetical protein [Flavisolibacter sp.]
MKQLFVFVCLPVITFTVWAQPPDKVYWVGPETGGTIGSSNWATVSGGAASAYPSNVNYQLVFDGGGVAGKSYTINMNTTTGGYFVVTNNTTVTLQRSANNSFVNILNSGYNVQAGSKLVLENNGTGSLHYAIASAAYNSSVAGELMLKSPFLTCTQFSCSEIWLNLAAFATPFPPTKSLTVSGTLHMEGTKSLVHSGANSYLVFGANSKFIIDADQNASSGYTFDPTSTIIITGAGKGNSTFPASAYLSTGTFGNIVYECPSQTVNRPLFSGNGWTVNGHLTVKNTGNAELILSSGTIARDLLVQGLPNAKTEGRTALEVKPLQKRKNPF